MDGRERPKVTQGVTQRIETGSGGLYVIINEDSEGPIETFSTVGKSGGYTEAYCEGISRLISLCFREGVHIDKVINQLDGIKGPNIAFDDGDRIESVPDAISVSLERYKENYMGVEEEIELSDLEQEKEKNGMMQILDSGENPECPECSDMLTIQEGCKKCNSCGWSAC